MKIKQSSSDVRVSRANSGHWLPQCSSLPSAKWPGLPVSTLDPLHPGSHLTGVFLQEGLSLVTSFVLEKHPAVAHCPLLDRALCPYSYHLQGKTGHLHHWPQGLLFRPFCWLWLP